MTREDLQEEIDELGLSAEEERGLFETDLNSQNFDAVIQKIAGIQNSPVPGVTKRTLDGFRTVCAEYLRLEGEDGVRGYLDATRNAASHGHPTLHAALDLMEREFLPNPEKPKGPPMSARLR